MPKVIFTENLRRHIDCPASMVEGNTVLQALKNVFEQNPKLKGYILDDQDRLRQHMLVSINGDLISDRIYLSDAVEADSEIYVIQALSGG